MFKIIKRDLYFSKLNKLFNQGFDDGRITEIDDEFYSKMDEVLICDIPASLHLKYLKPTLPPGKCYDRSLYMFFCFPESLLVRGNNKDLELRFGKDNGGHGWLEMNGYVYDPSLLLRFDKELYYEMFLPTKVRKCNREEYNKDTDNYYEEVRSVTRDDYRPGGSKRYQLSMTIPILMELAKNDEAFEKELIAYLEDIKYDEEQIYNELNECFQKVLKGNLK